MAVSVLVVDDSPRVRQTLRETVDALPGCRVVGTAGNGREAIAKTLSLAPDLVLLDIEMPEMDGFGFLRWILPNRPVPVIVVSTHADRGSVFRFLEAGAVDFLPKPTDGSADELERFRRDLSLRLEAIPGLRLDRLARRLGSCRDAVSDLCVPTPTAPTEVVAVGASTGGPTALRVLLDALPRDFAAPVVISQHMPRGYTGPFAQRLNRSCPLPVSEAGPKDIVERGRVYLAPGGFSLGFRRAGRHVLTRLIPADDDERYVPSVDRMFLEAAGAWPGHVLGILLTGMGRDGARGLMEIRRSGGYTIAESDKSAVVYGMPGAAVEAGAVVSVHALSEIPAALARLVGRRDPGGRGSVNEVAWPGS